MAAELEYDAAPRKPRSRFAFLFTWTGLFMLGWLIYELTSKAALGVLAFCVKFGWEDLCTAVWLRRKDPIRSRAKVGFWVYVASGLWKAAVTGFVLAMIVVAVFGDGPKDELEQAALMVVLGFPASAFATFRALALAWWYGQKIWLSGGVHAWNRYSRWSPPAPRDLNKARTVMRSSTLVAIAFYIVIFILLIDPKPAPRQQPTEFEILMISLLMGSVPISLFALCVRVEQAVVAESPDACWGRALTQNSFEEHHGSENLGRPV